ncbi:MAG TPA: MBOAT family O-acyltransferase [Steroidobacteraceae bacterium]|nr:MBOAT family O-acyltransferase [Steroidobacteraceae bacterium]
MLFTTAAFAFLFLPVVIIGFYSIARLSHMWAAAWLFAASVFFYGYWMPSFTLLLLSSIVVNFFVGRRIGVNLAERRSIARGWMIAGVIFNLAVLSYFKYANFFIDTARTLTHLNLPLVNVILPIGISFYTFTQIAFLADAYQKGVREYKFIHYGLFVTYFPHLVAGPVLHHAQMMPQFGREETYRFQLSNFAAGVAIFSLGLIKKVVLADGISQYADAVFDAVAKGAAPTFHEAWLGSLAYTFQLYFDFSGYSDMAIGLSWMLNIRLPFNFNSPYKSLNIIDFWRRWHMTLSAFLRDYLYIALGGNRHGPFRRYVNLGLTMLLGGLWHGANWTFVFWGGLHGLYLGINHAFRAMTERFHSALSTNRLFMLLSWLITFLAVVIAWVFFRAPTFGVARDILQAMLQPSATPTLAESNRLLWNAGLHFSTGLIACLLLGAIAIAAPNSNRIGEWIQARCQTRLSRRAAVFGAAITLMILLVVLNEARESVSAFIYFNF